MAKAPLDRRTQRTRKALHAAFVKLVLSRGYEGLTAGEICAEANVGRSTFYLHYPSKEALLKESLKVPCNGLASCLDEVVTAPQVAELLEHFREQRTHNRVFFTPPIRSVWVKCLAVVIESRLKHSARSAAMRLGIPRSLTALIIAESQIALITHWLSGKPSLKSEIIAAALIANTRALL